MWLILTHAVCFIPLRCMLQGSLWSPSASAPPPVLCHGLPLWGLCFSWGASGYRCRLSSVMASHVGDSVPNQAPQWCNRRKGRSFKHCLGSPCSNKHSMHLQQRLVRVSIWKIQTVNLLMLQVVPDAAAHCLCSYFRCCAYGWALYRERRGGRAREWIRCLKLDTVKPLLA